MTNDIIALQSDTRSELYEHVKDSQSQYDTQTMDAATANQEQTQPVPMMQEDEDRDDVIDDDTEMKPDDSDQVDVGFVYNIEPNLRSCVTEKKHFKVFNLSRNCTARLQKILRLE